MTISDLNWFVIVGTRPDTAHPDYRDSEGVHLWGPFDRDEAFEFERQVADVFDSRSEDDFVYGTPFIEAVRLQQPNDFRVLVNGQAAIAASNWYLDRENA